MKERPEIKHYRGNTLVTLKAYKTVKKSGKGGHIVLPKELIGKRVYVIFEEEK